jgi:outer membrane protein assembly factor BamB
MERATQQRRLIAAVLVALAAMAYVAWRPQAGPVVPANAPAAAVAPAPALNATVAQPDRVFDPARLDRSMTSASGPGDWAMEGYDPGRTRTIAAEVVLPLTQRREVRVADDAGYGSPPAIARGMMLVESKDQLHAFDLRSGTQRWAIPQPGAYISPAIAGNRAFIRAETGNKGQILALDLASGKQIWGFTPKRLSSVRNSYFGGHLTSPVVVEGMVFIGAGKEVYALDAKTGTVLWEFAAQDYITSSASIAGGRLYISDFTHFYALDQHNGTLLWSYPTTTSIYFSAVAAGETVLVSNGEDLIALDAASGMQRWSVRIPGEVLIPAAIRGSQALIKSTSTLYALDMASGKELWRFHDTNYVSLPAVAGNMVFVIRGLGPDTAITVLDIATGRSTWQQPVASLATTAPVIAGQALYVRTTDGRVLGFWH